MKGKEKAKVIPLNSTKAAEKFYYKLRVDSELGKKFADVCNQGVADDNDADKFAKKLGAKMYIPSLYADFGGINAFVLPVKPEPDPTLWKKVDKYGDDPKLAVYIFNTNVELRVCLFEEFEKVPDDEHYIKGIKEYSYTELLGTVKMKDIAAAAGIEMKYASPVVFLEYLKFGEKDIKRYMDGKVSVETLLRPKFLCSRRDKQMEQLAIKADAEHKSVIKQIRDKKFGLYNYVVGTDEAVHNYYVASFLPCVPAGTLNGLLQIKSHRRIGFARINEWFYILSAAKSELATDNDFVLATEDEWESVVAQVTESQKKKSK